ncbi:MAG: RtcB family protein [Turicibacter sp.]
MVKIEGKYGQAVVMTNSIEVTAIEQIKELCDQPWTKKLPIRVMPDCHTGIGCVIGLTMPITDTIVSNLVGVDIGCGMEVCKIEETYLNFKQLDKIIHAVVPSGREIRKKLHPYYHQVDLTKLYCWPSIKQNEDRIKLSLGSLGGGNHFIEVNQDTSGSYYLVIHSGSRQLGTLVANYYQNIAQMKLEKSSKKGENHPPYYLSPLTDVDMMHYLHDITIVQHYAYLNRRVMMDEIIRTYGLSVAKQWTTIHNYIEPGKTPMLRKGAIAAHKDELVIIPLNMRDGSIIGTGKGNKEWNESAPHGAGRLMSRTLAKERLNMEEYIKIMEGVYSTSISQHTLDEAPMAYKDKAVILESLHETVELMEIIKPVYNFKAT